MYTICADLKIKFFPTFILNQVKYRTEKGKHSKNDVRHLSLILLLSPAQKDIDPLVK